MLDRETLFTSLHAGLLMAILGVVVWLTGRSFVFPSLGPSAFVLAWQRCQAHFRRNVIDQTPAAHKDRRCSIRS